MLPETYSFYCVECGDFFSFQNDKSPREAAIWHIIGIAGLKGATLGTKVVVRDNYKGKILARFDAQELLRELVSKFTDWRHTVVGQSVHFRHRSRGSRFQCWQGIFRTGTRMFRTHIGHSRSVWIAAGLTRNLVTGELP